jgi:hypothetical protein
MDPIEIPEDTLQRLRDMEENKNRIQQQQSLTVQTLLEAKGVDLNGGVQYDLQQGVIREEESK